MANLAGFDASKQGDMMDRSPIPAQKVLGMMTASEMKPTKNGNGAYLQCEFTVMDGPSKGRKVWTRLNLNNPNQTAVDIATRELAAICKAVGIITPQDSVDLHNRPMMLDIGIEKGDAGQEDQNKLKGYSPAGSGAPSGFVAPAGVAQQAPAPAAAPAVAPWLKQA